MIFHPAYPLDGLRGADYNPRQIGEVELARLRQSLDRLGVCKPIIVHGQTIVAGHQRVRSLRALGRSHAPAAVLEAIKATDEIRFNQSVSETSDIQFLRITTSQHSANGAWTPEDSASLPTGQSS